MSRRYRASMVVLVGAALGAVVLGLGGRVATAALARATGRATNLSFGGLAEVLLVGTAAGALGGLLLLAARRLPVRGSAVRGLLVGIVLFLLSLLVAYVGHGAHLGENVKQALTLAVAAAVFVVYGIALDRLVD